MPPKQKAGRQQNPFSRDEDASSRREQELEAQVAALQKQLRIEESNHREQLQNATAIDPDHYVEVIDRVEELQKQNDQLQAKLDEASGALDSQGQEQSAADHQQISEPVSVLPKELKPSKKDHTLHLIDTYTRKKQELLQHMGRVAKEQQETTAAIATSKQRIGEIKAQARSMRSQGADSTQPQMFATRHGPLEFFTSEQSLEHAPNAQMSLEPPPLDAYPMLTSNHPNTHMGPNFSTPPVVYSEVGQNSAQTLKFVRYKNVNSFEHNTEQKMPEVYGQEDEHKGGENVAKTDSPATE
ncbi:hypothetical protein SLS60_004479 [Paraconiothyrium brasiliense]|uniref:Uncharacterized protein n=1 Tax=Paraconiothyrium brasiliense TaxID=300254 RepID=A0ABR3RKX9_9PLEO